MHRNKDIVFSGESMPQWRGSEWTGDRVTKSEQKGEGIDLIRRNNNGEDKDTLRERKVD